jgi:hypothetical protein
MNHYSTESGHAMPAQPKEKTMNLYTNNLQIKIQEMTQMLEDLTLADSDAWDDLINEATDAAHYLDMALKSILVPSGGGALYSISMCLADDIAEAKWAFENLATVAFAQREEAKEIAKFEREERASRR